MLTLLLACNDDVFTLSVDPSLDPGLTLPGPDGEDRPLARLAFGDRTADFAASDLIVAGERDDAEDIARSIGDLVYTVDASDLEMPSLVLVRVPEAPVDEARLAADLRALTPEATGRYTVSSTLALSTLATAARLARDGVAVTVDLRLEDATFLDGRSVETGGDDAFAWPHLADGTPADTGVTRAWQALELAGRDGAHVPVAIVDHEILRDRDYAARSVFLAETDNTEDRARFHGTMVASILASPADDGFGAAGVAAPVADLLLYEGNEAFLNGAERVLDAARDGARVVNLSWGVGWPEAFAWLLEVQQGQIRGARASGMMVVAAAGNDGRNITAHDGWFGAESTFYYPCEIGGVFCVGGDAWNTRSRDSGSNWGTTVDLYAPYTVWVSNTDGTDGTSQVDGTSFASPFVAGAAALVMAADPSLDIDSVERILRDTAHGEDGRPSVDVDAAVRSALGNVPPLVRDPGDVEVGACDEAALAVDVEDDELPAAYLWRSDVDGVFSRDPSPDTHALRPGVHQVTVVVTDPGGLTGSAAFQVTIANGAPTATITSPADGEEFCAGETVELRAVGGDCDLEALTLGWSVSGTAVGTGDFVPTVVALGDDRVRLVATDPGGRTGVDAVGISVVACTDSPPEVTITAPATDTHSDVDGLVYTGYDDVLGLFYVDVPVAATADDLEDGALPVIWTTDRTDLQPATLIPDASGMVRLYGECWGELHTLSATAVDANGNESRALRTVFVWTLC